ncbi:MAG: hypothetical protein ACLPJJ_05195 [Acidocella sp.]|uniref:hypothetical protein n=1 Tax=Acidocella sp. TaxID=50710 RepID=UPI003FD87D0C
MLTTGGVQMIQKSLPPKPAKHPAEAVVRDIRRATRRHYSAEDENRIVLEGPVGTQSCLRRNAIFPNKFSAFTASIVGSQLSAHS